MIDLIPIIETFEEASGLSFDELKTSEEWGALFYEEVGRAYLDEITNEKEK